MITVPIMNNTNHSSSQTPFIPNLKIATHNVRSFNDPAKQNFLFSLYSTNQYDIIGLQETNFKGNISIFNRDFPDYITFFSNNQNSRSSETGSPRIAKHIYAHNSKLDRIIFAKLQFTNKRKL